MTVVKSTKTVYDGVQCKSSYINQDNVTCKSASRLLNVVHSLFFVNSVRLKKTFLLRSLELYVGVLLFGAVLTNFCVVFVVLSRY